MWDKTRGIINLAGEPGDRWLALSAAGRRGNPSPLRASGQAGGKSGHRGFRSQGREPTPLGSLCGPRGKGDAPGNARGAVAHVMRAMRLTESATENKPPAEWSTVASRRETCKTPAKAGSAVRVKRWGKSPPPVWRQTGHGKPRVVQGQIGGESRPGSMSVSSFCRGESCDE